MGGYWLGTSRSVLLGGGGFKGGIRSRFKATSISKRQNAPLRENTRGEGKEGESLHLKQKVGRLSFSLAAGN